MLSERTRLRSCPKVHPYRVGCPSEKNRAHESSNRFGRSKSLISSLIAHLTSYMCVSYQRDLVQMDRQRDGQFDSSIPLPLLTSSSGVMVVPLLHCCMDIRCKTSIEPHDSVYRIKSQVWIVCCKTCKETTQVAD